MDMDSLGECVHICCAGIWQDVCEGLTTGKKEENGEREKHPKFESDHRALKAFGDFSSCRGCRL